MRATGTFTVKLNNILAYNSALGRRSIDKQFTGDLVAASKGEMLAAGGSVQGSAGYVALEVVTGAVAGRRGSFTLMHFGVMDRGAARLVVEVVPDSGTEELVGLSGTMQIVIAGGVHSYVFEYQVAGA